jgi:uncharacterized protein (TIGR02217 family)
MALNVDATRLPEYVERGARGGPKFDTTINTSISGVEQRVANRVLSRGEWQIGYGLRTAGDWKPVLALHYAQRGSLYGFTFRDWSDYYVTDGGIGTGDGATHGFQLIKTYDVGVRQYVRNIYAPDTDTIVVKVNGVATTDFLVEDGWLTLWDAPGVGAVITASFEFFVPVRFADDHLEIGVEMATDDAELAEITAVPLIEILAVTSGSKTRVVNSSQTIPSFGQVAEAEAV